MNRCERFDRWGALTVGCLCMLVPCMGCSNGGGQSVPPAEVTETLDEAPLPDLEVAELEVRMPDDAGPEEAAPEAVSPVLSGLTVEQFQNAPLSALVRVTTTPPASVEVTVAEAGSDRSFVVRETMEPAADHEIPLLGLRPDRAHVLSVRAVTETGPAGIEETRDLQTPPLPADAPPVSVAKIDKDRMSPGATLLNVGRWKFILDLDWGRMVALDESGDMTWYLELPYLAQGVSRLANGNLLFVAGVDAVIEMDMLGRVVKKWTAPEMGVDTFHHSATRLPNGNTLALSTEIRLIDGYVLPDGSAAAFNVVGDVVVEFTFDGTIVATWKLLDYLDPHVIKPDFLLPFWDLIYPGQNGGTKDWSHGNTVSYVEAEDAFIVTLATLSWAVKFDHKTGMVAWIAGDGGNFDLTGPGKWPVHAHAGKLLPDERLLLADGGQKGAEHSPRPVIYALSPSETPGQNGTAVEDWSYEQEPFLALGPGETDVLGNGNILFTDGTHVEFPDLPPLSPSNLLWVRVQELTREMPPELVFEATVKDATEAGIRYMSTGSERLPSLYPPGFELVPISPQDPETP